MYSHWGELNRYYQIYELNVEYSHFSMKKFFFHELAGQVCIWRFCRPSFWMDFAVHTWTFITVVPRNNWVLWRTEVDFEAGVEALHRFLHHVHALALAYGAQQVQVFKWLSKLAPLDYIVHMVALLHKPTWFICRLPCYTSPPGLSVGGPGTQAHLVYLLQVNSIPTVQYT